MSPSIEFSRIQREQKKLSKNLSEGSSYHLNKTTKYDHNHIKDSPIPDKHNLSKRDLPAIYQRDQVKSCNNAASTSIISGAKAVDFAAFAAGILTLVLNVNNNVNNNNNNNNNLNINAVDSSNIVANFNTNNANQVT